ncbi:MAG TPA: response regulator [Usitatibacter sp.]|nr:response regulator [Usitatibacter sp.]
MSRTILAVDDSLSMRRMVAHVLRLGGYEVLEAGDGEEALEVARSRQVDAVLTDQSMPKMDGIALVRRLRAIAGYADTPIMVLTTESSADMKRKGREAGATGWMVKPFDPERLLQVFQRIVP